MLRHLDRVEIVLAEGIGQAGVGVGADMGLADAESSSTYWRSSSGPSAQLRPKEMGFTTKGMVEGFRGLAREGATEASVMVPEIITGRLQPSSSNTRSTAKAAALALRVSKMVSIR